MLAQSLTWTLGLIVLINIPRGFAAEQKLEQGFVSMFDGKSLEGWTVTPSKASKAWWMEDGMIIGQGGKGRSYLEYDRKDIADFEMRFSYRFPGEGNSGVSIRARKDPTGKRGFQSYHADLGHVGIGKQVLGAWDFHTPGRTEHACFRGERLIIDQNDKPALAKIEGAVTKSDIRKNDWNDVRIIAHDNNFKFYINGKPASEFTEHLEKKRRLDKGMIQLQLHDPGMIVHFKELRIRIDR